MTPDGGVEAVPLFLIGMPGSGKSTLGRALSGYGYSYCDLDEAIEADCGMAVSRIVATRGMEAFRAMEAAKLRRLIAAGYQLIACGGGTPCHHGNMEYMNSCGITVLLQCNRERLLRRIAEAGDSRPMFAGLTTAEEIAAKLDEVALSRADIYSRAARRFDSSLLETADEIAATCRQFVRELGIRS